MNEPNPAETPVCVCHWDTEDRGGGYFEPVFEPEPDCPEHGPLCQPPQDAAPVEICPAPTTTQADAF